jgi:two-component system sensor histidine kinase VicK
MAAPTGEHGALLLASILLDHGMTEADLIRALGDLGFVASKERVRSLLEQLVALGLARLVSTDGAPARYVATVLARQRAAAVEAGAALQGQLAELEQLRTELISAVAHELRTPLTSIRTSASLLQDTSLHPSVEERRRLLANISRSAERMQQFVADVLDIARFRSGTVRLQLRPFDAVALADDVAQASGPMLEPRGQKLSVRASTDALSVYADRQRIEQVLVNFLSNASRFSPDGSEIALEVSAAAGDVVWSVRDPGPGIPEEDRPRLFERFFTADHRSQQQSGTGLGLPISLAIAEAHKGSIQVETEVGRGSTFSLRIPATSLAHGDGR